MVSPQLLVFEFCSAPRVVYGKEQKATGWGPTVATKMFVLIRSVW